MIEGKLQQAVTAAEMELVAHVLPVRFHGARTDLKRLGDLLGGAILPQ